MFQDYKLVPWLTVRDNLTFGHASDLTSSAQFKQITDLLGLSDRLDEYPSRLSGGLKERTALGRALLGAPEVLILDEPLGSTDYVHRLEIEDYLFKRIRSDSIAALMVTHDLDQAIANADRIILLPRADPRCVAQSLTFLRICVTRVLQRPALLHRWASLCVSSLADYEALL